MHGGHDITGVPIGQTAPPGTPQFLDKGDEIVGGAGNDTLNGGPGDDKMYGDEQTSLALDADEPGAETVEGEAPGNDLIEGGAGADDIWGGRGNDEVLRRVHLVRRTGSTAPVTTSRATPATTG